MWTTAGRSVRAIRTQSGARVPTSETGNARRSVQSALLDRRGRKPTRSARSVPATNRSSARTTRVTVAPFDPPIMAGARAHACRRAHGHGSERHAREPAAQSPRAVAPLLLGLPFRFHLAAAGGRIPIAAVPLARLLITLHCRGLGLGLVLAAAFRIPPTVPDAVLAGPLLRGVLGLRQHRAGRIRRRREHRRPAHGHKQRCCNHRCATHAKHCLPPLCCDSTPRRDRKSTRLNSSHLVISYAVFCLKKKKKIQH